MYVKKLRLQGLKKLLFFSVLNPINPLKISWLTWFYTAFALIVARSLCPLAEHGKKHPIIQLIFSRQASMKRGSPIHVKNPILQDDGGAYKGGRSPLVTTTRKAISRSRGRGWCVPCVSAMETCIRNLKPGPGNPRRLRQSSPLPKVIGRPGRWFKLAARATRFRYSWTKKQTAISVCAQMNASNYINLAWSNKQK